jgi:hypothetical protein
MLILILPLFFQKTARDPAVKPNSQVDAQSNLKLDRNSDHGVAQQPGFLVAPYIVLTSQITSQLLCGDCLRW